jgi:very-short-patch-repair endonuclease
VIAALAARQHAVFTVVQLLAVGLSRSAISKRARRGVLHRVHHGVYSLVPPNALSPEGRSLAAVLAAGPGAALSHLSAAKHRRLWRYRLSLIDVVAPSSRRIDDSVRVHRARNLDRRDVTVYDGVPITTVARMLVDLAEQLTKWELTNIIHEAAFREIYSAPATCASIERATGRRVNVLKAAMAMHEDGSAGTKSRDELEFLIANERLGNPEPLVNVALSGYEVDFHWPCLKLALEVDGLGHARARTQVEDGQKEAAWTQAGYRVLRDAQEALRTASVASS